MIIYFSYYIINQLFNKLLNNVNVKSFFLKRQITDKFYGAFRSAQRGMRDVNFI
jgi:hypothetical protein